MWRTYHQLRTDKAFTDKWVQFLTAVVRSNACPTFYQYVTDCVFQAMIKQVFKISAEEKTHDQEVECDYGEIADEEANVIRYVSGYICHSLKKNLQSDQCGHLKRLDLLLSLDDLTTDEQDEQAGASEEWTNLLDRGGLVHVKSDTYMVFRQMELEVRKHLKSDITCIPKKDVVQSICKNEDIQFHWSILMVESEEDVAELLLMLLAEKFVTLRGFAFTSTWMEQFKQATKKTVQRSKALRRQVTS